MISLIAISIVVLAALIFAAVVVIRQLGSAERSLPVTAGWIDELSTDRYRPMLRLLDSSDIEFLRSASWIHQENGIQTTRPAMPDYSRLPALPGYGFQTGVHGAQTGIGAIGTRSPRSFRCFAASSDHVCFGDAGRAPAPFPVSMGYLHGGCGIPGADFRRNADRIALPGAFGDAGRRLKALEQFLRVLQLREFLFRRTEFLGMHATARPGMVHRKAQVQHLVVHHIFQS